MRMKRTRYIRKYFLTVPRIVIREPGIYEIKMKVSQVNIQWIAEAPPLGADPKNRGLRMKERAGEIERGSIDGEE